MHGCVWGGVWLRLCRVLYAAWLARRFQRWVRQRRALERLAYDAMPRGLRSPRRQRRQHFRWLRLAVRLLRHHMGAVHALPQPPPYRQGSSRR